tara:strand:+ start:138 stop:458 length:321 start_codon:yes stop_codon:yes gene_type:complete
MANFSEILDQAKKMQEKMKQTQEMIKNLEITGNAGGNLVKITLNGDSEIKKIHIDKSIFNEKKEMLEDLIIAAHTDAKQKLKIKTEEEISKVTGGVNLPEGFKFPV